MIIVFTNGGCANKHMEAKCMDKFDALKAGFDIPTGTGTFNEVCFCDDKDLCNTAMTIELSHSMILLIGLMPIIMKIFL